jgi:hypothetical protein
MRSDKRPCDTNQLAHPQHDKLSLRVKTFPAVRFTLQRTGEAESGSR